MHYTTHSVTCIFFFFLSYSVRLPYERGWKPNADKTLTKSDQFVQTKLETSLPPGVGDAWGCLIRSLFMLLFYIWIYAQTETCSFRLIRSQERPFCTDWFHRQKGSQVQLPEVSQTDWMLCCCRNITGLRLCAIGTQTESNREAGIFLFITDGEHLLYIRVCICFIWTFSC